jgi:hypothetical protein
MQYVITLPSSTTDEPGRFALLVEAEDASVIIDQSPEADALRLSTCLSAQELHAIAKVAGLLIDVNAIEQLPSDCCGGCGG